MSHPGVAPLSPSGEATRDMSTIAIAKILLSVRERIMVSSVSNVHQRSGSWELTNYSSGPPPPMQSHEMTPQHA